MRQVPRICFKVSRLISLSNMSVFFATTSGERGVNKNYHRSRAAKCNKKKRKITLFLLSLNNFCCCCCLGSFHMSTGWYFLYQFWLVHTAELSSAAEMLQSTIARAFVCLIASEWVIQNDVFDKCCAKMKFFFVPSCRWSFLHSSRSLPPPILFKALANMQYEKSDRLSLCAASATLWILQSLNVPSPVPFRLLNQANKTSPSSLHSARRSNVDCGRTLRPFSIPKELCDIISREWFILQILFSVSSLCFLSSSKIAFDDALNAFVHKTRGVVGSVGNLQYFANRAPLLSE